MFKLTRLRNVVAVGFLFFFAAGLWSESSAKQADDELLKMVPGESLFCIRVNNFEYTVNTVDQFLTGVSPIPMSLSVMARMQLARVLGSPQLSGVNMNGSFTVFAGILPSGPTETNPILNIFLGGLLPVTDYRLFISSNPNCGQPDEKGISKITSNGTPVMLVTQAGNYALFSSPNNYDKLVAMAKMISDARTTGLASALDAAEAKLATTEPVWAYGNVEQVSKTFAPLVFGQLEKIKTEMEKMKSAVQGLPVDPAAIINMYANILKTLMKETKSVSLTVRPKPSVCNLTVTTSAVPGTDMANMFVADASAEQENKLLMYLKDGAMMNFGFKINTPFWEKLYLKSIDLLATIAGESMTTDDIAKMKKLTTDWINCLGGPIACWFSIDAKSKPPFAFKYVIEVKDADKLNKVIEEATEMLNTSGIVEFYKSFGMEMSFAMTREVGRYKGVSIDSAKLIMKSADPNSPQAQMIAVMYGEEFNYRWGMTDGLWVCAIGGDVDAGIRQLIDEVKAGEPKQMASEIKAALSLLPEASKADFMATYNFLRSFKMLGAFAPVLMPMLQMDIPTKSNIIFAGKVGGGKIAFEIALPKEHLTEIMSVFLKMQQQKEAMTEAPEQDKRAVSLNNLKQIALACILYADEHDGKFAPDLQQLYPYHRNPKILESPHKPEDFDGPSYIYIAGLNMAARTKPWKIIIAYENPAFCSDRICAAFLDGHSESMRPAEFLKQLQATYEQLGRKMPEIKFKGQ